MSENSEGFFERITGLPDDVLGVRARGKVTSAAYEGELIPMVEAQIAKTGKVRLLYVIGPEFDGITAGAAWDDAKLGMLHLREFERVAVVTDVEWVRMGIRMFGPLLPGAMRVFSVAQLDDAKEWIARDDHAKDSAAA